MTEKAEKRKIPFKMRFKAWWEGYDLEDMLDQMEGSSEDQSDKNKPENDPDHEKGASLAPVQSSTASEKDNTGEDDSVDDIALVWDEHRIEISQLIWGIGYCGPGGPEHVASMAKQLSLSPEMSALVMGAELGGPSRLLAKKFGVWISGYEVCEDLVAKANDLSIEADLDKKVVISAFDVNEEKPFDRSFDRAFSKERLYTFEDKESLLQKIYDALKEKTFFLLTDYTLSSLEALEDKDVQQWLKLEPSRPYPVTADIINTLLKKVGFSVRVNENISDTYVELITDNWAKADKIVENLHKKGDAEIQSITTMMKEAEFWSLRKKLLKKDLIGVSRFLVYKPGEPIR